MEISCQLPSLTKPDRQLPEVRFFVSSPYEHNASVYLCLICSRNTFSAESLLNLALGVCGRICFFTAIILAIG